MSPCQIQSGQKNLVKNHQQLQNQWFLENIKITSDGSQSTNCQNQFKPILEAPQQCPNFGIGRVITSIQQYSFKDQFSISYGTGFLISKRIVLTMAHNVFLKLNNGKQSLKRKAAENVFFQVQISPENRKLIKVLKYGIHPEYINQSFLQFKEKRNFKYDLAILFLEQNDLITQDRVLKLKFDYSFAKYPKNQVMISGFPKVINYEKNIKFYQYNISKMPISQRFNLLTYSHYTSEGNSGSPLLIMQNGELKVFGVHKGNLGNSYCVLLNQQKNQLIEIVKLVSVGNSVLKEKSTEFKEQFYKLMKLIKFYDTKEEMNKNIFNLGISQKIYKMARTRHNNKLMNVVDEAFQQHSQMPVTISNQINPNPIDYIKQQLPWMEFLDSNPYYMLKETRNGVDFFGLWHWDTKIKMDVSLNSIGVNSF